MCFRLCVLILRTVQNSDADLTSSLPDNLLLIDEEPIFIELPQDLLCVVGSVYLFVQMLLATLFHALL